MSPQEARQLENYENFYLGIMVALGLMVVYLSIELFYEPTLALLNGEST